ncbi:MAG: ABC transporter permease [Defluviitaleaceae bacterium]|nr:ABC transporter permease [Defluviitaleaceae bacterium]
MTIFYYALLRGAIRNTFSLVVNCFIPIALIFVRPFWTQGVFGITIGFGLLAFVTMSGAYLMSLNILKDKAEGAIHRILAAPVTMRQYLMQNLLACMVPLTAQMLIISALGYFLYDWSITLSLAIFLCYSVLMLASVAMAFAWHCLFKDGDQSASSFMFLLTFMAVLGGLFVPTEFFPGVLQYLGAIFPVYWGIQGLNSVLETGAISSDFWLPIAAMLLFTAAFLLYGGKRRII